MAYNYLQDMPKQGSMDSFVRGYDIGLQRKKNQAIDNDNKALADILRGDTNAITRLQSPELIQKAQSHLRELEQRKALQGFYTPATKDQYQANVNQNPIAAIMDGGKKPSNLVQSQQPIFQESQAPTMLDMLQTGKIADGQPASYDVEGAGNYLLGQANFDQLGKLTDYRKAIANDESEWGTNPTKGINPSTGLADSYITDRKGNIKWLGSGVYETPKDAKTSLVKTSKGFEVVRDGDLPEGAPVETQTQPKQRRLQQVTDATGTYILDLDTGETRPILVNGKPVAKPLQSPSGEESNAAGFLVRMKDATKLLDTFENKGKPNIGTSVAGGVPFVGGYLERTAQTKEQQQYKNAALAWIRAKLRKESGAAIGIDEAKQEYENYFPVVGDTAEVIAQKRSLRNSAMDEMRLASGKAAIKVDEVRPVDKRQTPPKNNKGWVLHTDKNGNKAYVSPDGKQFEEVK